MKPITNRGISNTSKIPITKRSAARSAVVPITKRGSEKTPQRIVDEMNSNYDNKI